MKILLSDDKLEEARQLCMAGSKHDELQSIGRFWYQETRDFPNSKRTVKIT
jgi:hypothetical protein